MKKEIYFYSGLYSYIAEAIMTQMEAFKDEEDLWMRMNTPGGSLTAMWGICAKMQELGNVNIQVDGSAYSAGLYCLPFAKYVTCLDVSVGLLHRAASESYNPTPEEVAFAKARNKDLKAKFAAKIDSKKLKELKGVTLDEIFDEEKERIDVILTAKEMKAIGLVDKIIKLDPSEISAYEEMYRMAASAQPPTQTSKTMTLEKLKAEHPELYAQVVALGVTAGEKQERIRVKSWIAFAPIDLAACVKGIKEGSVIEADVMAEMQVKAMTKKNLAALAEGSEGDIITEESEEGGEGSVTEPAGEAKKKKDLNAFAKNAGKLLGLQGGRFGVTAAK